MPAYPFRVSTRLGVILPLLVGVMTSSSTALAGDVDPTLAERSRSVGAAALKYELHRGLPTSIETGFLGPSFAKVNVGIKLEPVTNGGPLFAVEMPKGALVEASWGHDRTIRLRARDGEQTDGVVDVRHTLAPSIDFKFNGFGLNATYSYDASDLVNMIPGARFSYDSRAQSTFVPWAFSSVKATTGARDLENAVLFSMNMNKLPAFVANNVTGQFGVRAVTTPTFSYKTTKIFVSGADGELTDTSSELAVPATDGDFMEFMVAVEGELGVQGAISIQPFVRIDTILESNVSAELDVDVFSVEYEVPPQKVHFDAALVHVPLPNVRVPDRGVDLGLVDLGAQVSEVIRIDNTGEQEASMSFESSNPRFSLTTEKVTVPPKSFYELAVTYAPDTTSPEMAEITVLSTDPDSPRQTFKVGANGADVGQSDENDDGASSSASDGGCGCKAAKTDSTSSWAGASFVALAALVAARRRRALT